MSNETDNKATAHKVASKITLCWILCLAIVLSGACSPAERISPTQAETALPAAGQSRIFPVDALFAEFYRSLGGEAVLGPAISPLLESGNLKSQYLFAGQMIFDPQAVKGEQYHLASLGVTLGIAEPAIPKPAAPRVRYMNGHIVYEEFIPFYEQLGGAQFVGRPLTEVHHNPEVGRLEQYFENLGFYRLDSDPSGQVRLLAYGAYACDWRCPYTTPLPSDSIPSIHPLLPEPFASEVARLSYSFVGRTLSEPYLTPDGRLEVIFENVVLTVESAETPRQTSGFFWFWLPLLMANRLEEAHVGETNVFHRFYLPLLLVEQITRQINFSFRLWLPLLIFGEGAPKQLVSQEKVTARPIVDMVGIQTQSTVSRREDALMVFYAVAGEKGYHVPRYLDDYIQRHGGLEFFGAPIGEIFPLSEGVFRQCFTNLCLDFDVNAPADHNLKPASLGARYKERYYDHQSNTHEILTPDNVRMQVQELRAFVPSTQPQEITLTLTDRYGPLAGREAELLVTWPDNTQQSFDFPATDVGGHATLLLPPVVAINGSLVDYTVCAYGVSEEALCIQDQYLIWNP